MDELLPGLYARLLTLALQEQLDRLAGLGLEHTVAVVDRAEQADLLARHLAARARGALEALDPEERVAASNRLLEMIARIGSGGAPPVDQLEPGPRELHAVLEALALARPLRRRPQIPLGRSDLLVNARGEPSLASEISAELTSADRVDLLCAFVKWYGLRLVLDPLTELARRGVPIRVITTTYVGATERRALDELVGIGAVVKVTYETQRTRLHAKAWLFRRNSGLDTAYVGSSNLSRSALVDGLEWNVRLSRTENPSPIDKFAATFDSYWADPGFETYCPARDADRLDAALGAAHRREPLRLAGLEVRPFPYQQDILDRLDAERRVHDRWRNLVVAATGTGKTVMAALDYKRLRPALGGGDPTLLYVAHRKEILEQSQATFAAVLNDAAFGEQLVAGQRPERWRHVFASVQSLSSKSIDQVPPGHFDMVVIDEFHHAEAMTYRRLLSHLAPRVLLGLTATPERADGQDVTHWFGGQIAAELRLWDALEQELLCPFHYFGVADGTDLSGLSWQAGGYDTRGLDSVYTGNDARARVILRQVEQKLPDPHSMRALGFCVSKAHAAYMAEVFTNAGLPSQAVDADTPASLRTDYRRRLARGDLRAIFSVDVFNEGLDVPEVDTVLLLRPTESATVFLQQLGRGLRHAPGKACLTALDFIGLQNKRFRFDVRLRALTGCTRSELERQVHEGFPFLPSGCHLELDRVASQHVVANLRDQVAPHLRQLVGEVRSYGDLGLGEYLREAGRDPADIYRRASWSQIRREVPFPTAPAGPHEGRLLGQVKRFSRVDDLERADTWRRWLRAPAPPNVAALSSREQRLATMLVFNLWQDGGGHADLSRAFGELWRHPAVCAEIADLLEVAREAIARVPLPLDHAGFADVPLSVHATYNREELLTALGHAGFHRSPTSDREGVRFVKDIPADVFTFTVQKTLRNYSPTTMYRDYALSSTLVHWESQSTTAVDSPTGVRYREHIRHGSHILLFGRQTESDVLGTSAYLFLGPAEYVSHEGSRPIAFTWRLQHALPADFFSEARVLAG